MNIFENALWFIHSLVADDLFKISEGDHCAAISNNDANE